MVRKAMRGKSRMWETCHRKTSEGHTCDRCVISGDFFPMLGILERKAMVDLDCPLEILVSNKETG